MTEILKRMAPCGIDCKRCPGVQSFGCKGCREQVEKVMVKLRFIGKPGGKLVKGAPGNYAQGQIVTGPSDRAKYFPKIWQLAQKMPKLVIPKASEIDSVFEAMVPGEVEVIEAPVASSKEFNLLDPNRSSTRSFRLKGATSTDPEEDAMTVSEAMPTVEALESSTKAQLMAFLDSQEVEYKRAMKKAEILELAKSLL